MSIAVENLDLSGIEQEWSVPDDVRSIAFQYAATGFSVQLRTTSGSTEYFNLRDIHQVAIEDPDMIGQKLYLTGGVFTTLEILKLTGLLS